MQDVEKAKAKGLEVDGGVELVTADVTKGPEYASPVVKELSLDCADTWGMTEQSACLLYGT